MSIGGRIGYSWWRRRGSIRSRLISCLVIPLQRHSPTEVGRPFYPYLYPLFTLFPGQILVRFELTRSHTKKQSLQMRILEHLTAVTSNLPDYPGLKGRIPSLEPGTLISKRTKLGKATKPWTYALEGRKYGEVWKRFLKYSPGWYTAKWARSGGIFIVLSTVE